MTKIKEGKRGGRASQPLEAVRRQYANTWKELAEAAKVLPRASDERKVRQKRAAIAKAQGHLRSVRLILDCAEHQTGSNRVRLAWTAFDAAWLAWNSRYSRDDEFIEAKDRERTGSHGRLALGAVGERRVSALLRFESALVGLVACRGPAGAADSRTETVKVPTWEVVASAGDDSRLSWRVRLGREAFRKALAPDAGERAWMDVLYELRCRRFHGDLTAGTIRSSARGMALAAAATELTLLLVEGSVARAAGS